MHGRLHSGALPADLDGVLDATATGRRLSLPATPASPYDAVAALDALLGRLRAASGANRVAVWLHEATTRTVVPFARATCETTAPIEDARVQSPLALSAHRLPEHGRGQPPHRPRPRRRPGTARCGAPLATASASVHGEPLLHDGEVVGVLVVDPPAAASPSLLRHAVPAIAAALRAAAVRRSEQRRLEQAEVLLHVIEAAAGADSVEQLLGSACERLAALGDAERACVFLLEDGRLVPSMASYADGRRDRADWALFRSAPEPLRLAEEALRTGEPTAAEDSSPLLAGWWRDSFSHRLRARGAAGPGAVLLRRAHPRQHRRPPVPGGRAPARHRGRRAPGRRDRAGPHQPGPRGLAAHRARRPPHARRRRRRERDGGGRGGPRPRRPGHPRHRPQRRLPRRRHRPGLRGPAGRLVGVLPGRRPRAAAWAARPPRSRSGGRSPPAGARCSSRTPPPTTSSPPSLVQALDLGAFVALPLLSGDRLLGVVVSGALGGPRTWSEEARESVRRVVLEGALVVENAQLREVEQLRLRQLADEAHTDPLTGLPNRRRFIEELEATVYGTDTDACAVLMIDLDRFKEINDSFGHAIGDDLLCLVGPRLQTALRARRPARPHGRRRVRRPAAGRRRPAVPTTSPTRLGAALRERVRARRHAAARRRQHRHRAVPRPRPRPLAAAGPRRHRDVRGQARPRDGAVVWAPDDTPDPRDRLETLEQLRTALDTEQLVPHYQPKLDLRTGAVVGVEALVRWEHPHRDLLFPDVFLPLAEQAGPHAAARAAGAGALARATCGSGGAAATTCRSR